MSSCPNKSHPDWKALVNKVGERKAYQIYNANNMQIPNQRKVRRGVGYGLRGLFFRQATTLDQMEKNPQLFDDIVNKLRELYPEVRVMKNRIIDENGNYIELKPGEQGMHLRNAYQSVIAWSNDAYFETPPHEYAHHYIDMFRDHPLVKEGIEKYGEEGLVERMGKFYAGEFTNSKFKTWVNKFWNAIRSLIGSPDISYILTDHFKNADILDAEIHPGTGVVRYQSKAKPMKRAKRSVLESSQEAQSISSKLTKVNGTTVVKTTLEKYILKNTSDNRAKSIHGDFDYSYLSKIAGQNIEDIEARASVSKVVISYVRNIIDGKYGIKEIDKSANGKYRNSALLDQRILNDVVNSLVDESNGDVTALYMMYKLAGREDLFNWSDYNSITAKDRAQIQEFAENNIEVLSRVEKRLARINETRDALIIDKNNIIDTAISTRRAVDLIETTFKKRNQFFEKIEKWPTTGKPLAKFFRWVSRILTQYQGNARLQAKFLTGNEDNMFYDLFYEEFNQAFHDKNKILQKVHEIYEMQSLGKNYKRGSYFANKNIKFDEIDSDKIYDINVFSGGKVFDIKITQAELLSTYMLLQQEDSFRAIKKHGVILEDIIEGRESFGEYQLSDNTIYNIKSIVENNQELKDFTLKANKVYDILHNEVSKAFEEEMGYELPIIDNYFPIAQGQKQRQGRRSLKDLDYLRAGKERLGQSGSIRISDIHGVMNGSIQNASHYAAYNTKVRNAKMQLKQLEDHYLKQKGRADYKQIDSLLDALRGNVNRLEDNSLLYSNKAEEGFQKTFNKAMNNFSVSVLGMNIPVMFKQPVSYMIAKEVIDSKYLEQAGWGVGGIAGIKPMEVFNKLKYTGSKEGKTMLPVEWTLDENDPVYLAVKEHSPILFERFKGQINRELGETFYDSTSNDDIIEIPKSSKLSQYFGKGEGNIKVSKNRFMEGIKAFDTATVKAIWQAAELEATDKYGLDQSDGVKFYEHVARRTEEIVNKTQPTFDMNNRSSLASNSAPFARFLTMFSSARSKMAMLIMEGTVDYINNPTKENQIKFIKRLGNILVLNAAAITAIDLLKQALLGRGFDDDDEVYSMVTTKMISSNTGLFFGIGNVSDFIVSNLDDQPWRKNIQDPMSVMMEDLSGVFINTAKGDFGKATMKLIEGTAKIKGAPLYPYLLAKSQIKRFND